MNNKPFPKRAVHLDFHTMPGVYDVGRDFDPEAFARTLESAKIDYITVFAKCNLGFAYYPTAVGIVHPGLQRELLGPMVDACHRRGIRVAAYFNTGLDHEQALRHRDWCRLNERGQVYEVERMGHFFRRMCLNTAYRDQLLAMIAEVLEWYPVDGLFLDCMSLAPCYGIECLDGAMAQGLDPTDAAQALEFCRRMTKAFTQKVEQLVESKAKGGYIYFNGLPYSWQPTHIEIECLPPAWGYDFMPWATRYARTLDRPFFTMTGRFHWSWGDFGGIRPLPSLLFDCYNSTANGGTVSVGDHMHPRGRLEPAVYDLIGQAYTRTEQLDQWSDGAHSMAEMAIVEPALVDQPGGRHDLSSLIGATRMLRELKYQFDVCDGQGELSSYRLLVLPDRVRVDGALRHKLEEHLRRGGILIGSAFAGLNPEGTEFALDDYGLVYEGPQPHDPSFFLAEGEMARDLPEMLVAIYKPGIAMRESRDAKVLARLYRPYFNQGSWDWRHENLYTPPEEDSGRPALVQRGNVFHFCFPVFQAYAERAVVAYRTLLRNCIESVLPDPMVRVANMPSFGQVTVTHKAKSRIVHVMTYVPELRGQQEMIEEGILVRDVELGLRLDGEARQIRRAYLAPQETDLPLTVEGTYAVVRLPEVEGYQMVVFDLG